MGFPTGSSNQDSLYRLCWSNARDALLVAENGTEILVDANPSAETLTGYSRQELIGMRLGLLYPLEERERVKQALTNHQDALIEGFHLRRKDGHCVPVVLSVSNQFDLEEKTLSLFVLRDIAELDRQEHRLATQRWALSAYAGVALALGKADSSEGLLRAICEAITHDSAYVLAWVGVAENAPDKPVRMVAEAGSALGYLDGLCVSWDENDPSGRGPTGTAIRTGKVQMMEDSETVAAFVPWRCRAREFSLRSTLTIPLGDEGNWRGALAVYAEHPHAFEPAAVVVFEHLAGEISHGLHALRQRELLESERIKRARTQQQLTDALSSMVAALVTAVEMRDPYTAGHEAQVAEIAYAIGKEMGWDEDRLLGLRMASMVHDIGKISIPSEILTKPTKLSAAERALINEHPETGYAILKDIPFIWPIADMMRQHHEKLDGSGYPLGLKAEEILPEAKVLAVADIVDAMAANRPYRHSIALEKVLEEIERQAGHQLDAEVVRVCLKLFREKGFILPHLKHR